MKTLLKIVVGGVVVLFLIVVAMAFLGVCPPQGPWLQPPWCSGSSISWPFSNPSSGSESGVDADVTGKESSNSTGEDSDAVVEDDAPFDSEVSENERLGRVAVGLVQDLSTVNSYFNDAASSMGNLQTSSGTGISSGITGNAGSESREGIGEVPAGFTDPLPPSGYIPAPAGACAVGASPSASFLNRNGEKITPDMIAEKNIQMIGFEELTGGSIEGRKLEETIRSLIKPGDMDLATPDGWNKKVWNKLAEKQSSAVSLMDYHLWSVSDQIETEVVLTMAATLESLGLPSQVTSAFQASRTSGWYARQAPEEEDRISAMEIEAVFSGRTEGTIYEKRDFSLPELGEMPQFGPMSGEGVVVYHDPDFGDYPFDLELDWTKWDQLGRVTAGELVFTDSEHGVVIEMTVNEDNSRVAQVYREGVEVGIVNVDSSGEVSYQDLTE
jgi:hypothetical protein